MFDFSFLIPHPKMYVGPCIITVCRTTVVPTKSDSDHHILFTIAKSDINLFTPLELARIDRSLVY